MDRAKGLIGTPGAVGVVGTGSAQTEDVGSQSGRNGMPVDHRVGVNQRGSGGVDEMDIDQSGREADLGIAAHQRDDRGDKVGIENGRTGAGGIGVDLNKNGNEVHFDRADGQVSGQFLGAGAKNSEADRMDIDQSVSGAAHADKDGSEED